MREATVRSCLVVAAVAGLALLTPLAMPTHAAAQAAPQAGARASADDLLRAETRIREGRIAEARREVERWWLVTGGESTPEVVQFALWLRGVLTVDPSQADLDFQRIVLDFPRGPRAAPARLRLGQSAHASGDLAAALRHYRALDRDYPGTRFRLIARSWLDRYEAQARRVIGDTASVTRARTDRAAPREGGRTRMDRGRGGA